MTKIRAVPNPMRSDGSFLVIDDPEIAAKLEAAEANTPFVGSQTIARTSVCEFQLPHVLAEQVVLEVNAVFALPEYLSPDEPTLTDQVRKTAAVLRVGANLERSAVLAFLRKKERGEFSTGGERLLAEVLEDLSLGRHLV